MSVPTYKLSKEQQEKFKKVFNSLDADKSGFIEVRELGPVVSLLKAADVVIDLKNLEKVVDKFDKSRQKKLNLEQFSQMLMYILDLKNMAQAQASSTPAVKTITVTTGGSKPTTITTTGSNHKTTLTPLSPKSAGAKAPGSPLSRSPSAPRSSASSSSSTTPTLLSRSSSWTPPPSGSSPRASAPVSEPSSRSIRRKAPLRRLKDAFIRQFKEHSTVTVTVKKPKENKEHKEPKEHKEHKELSSHSSSSSKSPGSMFVDPTFAADSSVLPRHSASGVVSWKSPHEMCDKPRLFVDGTEEGDVVQGSLGNCWFIGALAVLASSGNDFIEHTFVKADVKRGEYKCKFYKDGGWVEVTVDDRLPCGASGKLYFASCPDPNEWWVPIIEKAYAKLHGSYEALESGTITDALKDMTGESVEMINVDSAEFKDKSLLWKKLLHYIKESFLMGCAIESASAGTEKDNGYGLLSNHAYSIIDCQEVQGHKLMRIRNPWGKGEWKGPWADGSKEWTAALLKHFDYEFGNDGTFFMKFEDFVKFYNRIHVLCLLTDDQGEVWKKTTIRGKWKGETAGGCSNNPTWPNNPQYMLVSPTPNNKIFIGMSQADLRYKHKKSPGKHGLQYEAIGVIVLKTSEQLQGNKVGPYNKIEREGSPVFMMQRDISFDFVAQADKTYVMLPCTYKSKVEGSYELVIYSQRAVKLVELQGSGLKK